MTVTYHHDRSTDRESLSEELRRARAEAKQLKSEFVAIGADLRALGAEELKLLRAETSEMMSATTRSLALGAGTLVAASLAAVFAALAITFAVATALPLWLSAFVTTALLVSLAIGCGVLARREFNRIRILPKRTLESIQEDVAWARNQMTFSAK